jgi:hypothetical protein
MSEFMRIESANAPNAVGGPGASRAEAFSGYRSGQEAAGNARVAAPMDGADFQNALKKLTRVIDAGKPLRHDVPRGFYLNLRV